MQILLGPAAASAQSCPLAQRPPFAGHAMPIEGDPNPQPMTFVPAFTALTSLGGLVGFEIPPDGSNRIFVVEQVGRIHVFENRNDVATSRVFLDIRSLVVAGGEQGLLGLAFDPDYATNRRFYVNYTATTGCTAPAAAGCSKIVRYETRANDPEQADPATRTEILEFRQPYTNHNGGPVVFGPDGMLYIATGDGGAGTDPGRNSQNLGSRLGKILRLDVRQGAPSIVPSDNPFVGTPGADPLVYHYGLRNPWRISFDRVTGDLYIADVGGGHREEVNRVRAGTPGGLNFGWDFCEGTRDFRSGARCSDIASTPPTLEYDHNDPAGGDLVIGGYVYRGDAFPELYGAYLYFDALSLRLWAWDGQDPVNPWNPGNPGVLISTPPLQIVSFGQDREGEIYGVSDGPSIYRLVRNGGSGGGIAVPNLLSQTGFFTNLAELVPAPGVVAYDVAAPLWSDGAAKRRWMALPGQGKVQFDATEAFDFPIGTAFVKHFELPRPGGGMRRVETRVFWRQTDRWVGVTYRWNSAQTDAQRVVGGLVESIDLGSGQSQSWRYPSESECLGCHTEVAGRVLGVRARQLGETFLYPNGARIQLEAWNCGHLFDVDIRDPARFARVQDLDAPTPSRIGPVRSYFATNCEMCHQPQGPAPGNLDFRFTRAVGQWNAVDVVPTQGSLGVANARRIAIGDRSRSIAWLRQSSNDSAIRMARGTLAPHGPAVDLIGDWIDDDLASIDSDGDGIRDAIDRCPMVPNPSQSDRDNDGLGNACDPDDQADLTIRSVGALTGPLIAGQTLSLSAVAENLSTRDAAVSFPVSFYLSRDRTLDAAVDTPIGHCWVESLNTGSTAACSTTQGRIPSDILPGNASPTPFYWIACADRGGFETDFFPANDCRVSAQTVSVPEPLVGGREWIVLAVLALVLARTRRETFAARATSGR
jgi:uncharacterized repeat protein (TIGR03806 family)